MVAFDLELSSSVSECGVNARGFLIADFLGETDFSSPTGFLGLRLVNVLGIDGHVGENRSLPNLWTRLPQTRRGSPVAPNVQKVPKKRKMVERFRCDPSTLATKKWTTTNRCPLLVIRSNGFSRSVSVSSKWLERTCISRFEP